MLTTPHDHDHDAIAATLLSGSRWGSGTTTTHITYSFSTAASRYSAGEAEFSRTVQSFSEADKATTRKLLATIEAVCNVHFEEVSDAEAGMVRYAYSAKPNDMGYAGYAFFPSTSEIGGNVWIGAKQAGAEWGQYRPNLILHETLHAIGLKHPFDGGAVLASDQDIIPNTVMSYSAVAGLRSGSLSNYPDQPMPYDIEALQALYGAAPSNVGDTVYDLAGADFSGFRAIWDSSGNDTLDASRCAAGVQLNLEPGARSSVGASIAAFGYLGGGGYSQAYYGDTLALTASCHIENATGSAFDDVLLGNDGDNVLMGGAGNDVLRGFGGRDTLNGGAGNDPAVFQGQRADYGSKGTLVPGVDGEGDSAESEPDAD